MTRIGDELNTPSFVTSNGVSSTVKHLYQRLLERTDEIIDYSFREYLETSEDFLINSLNEHDHKCAQVSVVNMLCFFYLYSLY